MTTPLKQHEEASYSPVFLARLAGLTLDYASAFAFAISPERRTVNDVSFGGVTHQGTDWYHLAKAPSCGYSLLKTC